MKRFIVKLWSIFVGWFEKRYSVSYSEDIPDILKIDHFYIVGEKSSPWLIAFKCPCGCGSDIQLNLLKEATPRWKYRLSSSKELTISPSVWRTKGCKSHFFVRLGKIDWVSSRRRRGSITF
jgi:hypothetical protein